MTIVFLAGGVGKRMWPLSFDKSLIPFLGKPLAFYNLTQLQNLHPDQFVIITRPESQAEFSSLAKDLGLNYQIVVQEEAKGMADAIVQAENHLNDELLIVNAEDLLEQEAYEGVLKEAQKGAEAVFAAMAVSQYFPGGYLRLEADKVLGVVEKPGERREPSDKVKLVVDYFKDGQKLLSYLKSVQSQNDDLYEVALDKMISDGVDIRVSQYSGFWQPLKYPWHILEMMEYFLKNLPSGVHSSVQVADNAVLEGPVFLEEGVKVFEGAVIKGPVYIGKNTIVAGNSLVRDSMISENCVIGYSTEVARSYLGPNCWFHTNYVGDSVIEGDFGMGSGAVLANLRLDNQTIKVGEERIDTGREKLGVIAGKGVRIGVNSSTMPGVRIGSNCLIGPGVVLHEDVKDNTKITLKQEYQTSEHTPTLTGYEQFREKLK